MQHTQPLSFLQELSHQFISWAPKIGVGALIICIFSFFGWVAEVLISRLAKTQDPQNNEVILLVANSCKVVILLIGCITALGSMGVNVSALVASLGLSGFALSFALKDALANVLAGVMLFMYKPFKIGDTLDIAGLSGQVSHLSLRYVHLKDENREILIPNSSLLINNIVIIRK